MKKPHLAIEVPEYFPQEFENLILDEIRHEKLELDFQRSSTKMYAALEWVIPGLIAIYIFKPYFESFLKEAGKDHYQILKKKINALLTKAKDMNIRKVTASESIEKLEKTNSQTGAISIFFETKQGYLIKLLYDSNLDLSVWQQATNQMFDLMEMHYEENDNDPISKHINQISEQKIGKEIFAIIDPETKNWILVHDIGQYIKESRNNNRD